MKKIHILFFVLAALAPAWGAAEGKSTSSQTIVAELMTGTAYNLPTGLTVHQSGQLDLQLTANYDTNPFGDEAPYYSWRVGLWDGDEAWEIQHIHHKLYLTNLTPEIQDLEMCHGFNYFFLGHAWKRSGLIFHLGVGPIVTHPQSIIRNQVQDSDHGGLFDAGYYISGIGIQGAVGKDLYLNEKLFVVLELAATSGWAWWAPTAGGYSEVTNLALHGHVGMGYGF